MSHLTMDQLLELREPGLEPGQAAAREHLDTCPFCQTEADRLAQRVARLRALPTPRPSRDQFLAIRAGYLGERRRHRLMRSAAVVLALAASVILVLLVRPLVGGGHQQLPVQLGSGTTGDVAPNELDAMMARSQALEEALSQYDPDSRAIDGRTAAIADRIEGQLSTLDRQIELLDLLDRADPTRQARQLKLWRERVGLLDALVDVHLTRASFAGL
jgi:hypothetical protein